jgi:phosphoglycolate phosphatase
LTDTTQDLIDLPRHTIILPYRLAIFDMDGTLADSFPWFLSVINSVADKRKFLRVEDDRIDELRSVGAGELVRLLGVAKWRIPLIMREMRKLKAAQLDRIPLFPGVDRLLCELKAKGIVIAIVSSDAEANVRRALGDHARFVAHYACGASLFAKAGKFRRILKLSGMSIDDTICIGDEIRDIDAAREVGIDFGAVTWGYTSGAALDARAPNYLFSRIDEVIAALAVPRR